MADKGFIVTGFDLSDIGVAIAKKAAIVAQVDKQTEFVVANAQQLPFEDTEFDLVIGKTVLHHTIKYEHIDKELYRVLKSGGKVFFLEGAASNPMIALARKFTLQEELSDTPLTVKKKFAHQFKRTKIQGFFFLYMFKRFGYYSSDESLSDQGQNKLGKRVFFRWFLRSCLTFDQLFINKRITATAGRFLIQLEK